ncbi:MAG: polymer-forming cytoskeletal protein [Alphaproteobacteria bacterium]|nr:polymer-forming cytoskeletal protein [Alphaproteobacteria bacterium]
MKPFSRHGSHAPARGPAKPSLDAARRLGQPAAAKRAEGNRLDPSDSRRLTIGREICLSGEVTSCDKLVVEGHADVTLIGARALEVMPGGVFRGRAEVKTVDVAGLFEGDMTATDRLLIRNGGRVSGNIRYGRIIIESGGEIAGEMQTLAAGETTTRALPAPKEPNGKF